MHQTYILFFINEKVFEQMYELRVKKRENLPSADD